MIRLRGLRVAYDRTAALEVPALHIARGEYVLLTGPSGSGKSTLLLALAGLIPELIPARLEGEIMIAGRDARGQRVAERARQVGMVYQNPTTQLFHETVAEEVAFGPRNLGLPEDEIARRVTGTLAAVGIAHLRERAVRELSGGEQQRVAIAATLAMGPSLLLLDELLANLDREGIQLVLETLARLHTQGVTILLAEHRVEAIAVQASRAIVLADGHIVADGPPAGVLRPGAPSEVRSAPPLPGVASAPLVALTGVSAGYRGRDVVRDITLTLHQGEFVALVGPNGAGKTTVARLLSGILRPRRGAVRWAAEVRRLPAGCRVGMLSQNPAHQILCDTVLDEVAYGGDNLGWPRDERLERIIAAADLGPLRHRPPQLLSAGQMQRTALAAALATAPRLLILDEPTLGQDRAHLTQLMDFLTALHRQGQTILLITHDERLVRRYAQRVVRLQAGRVVADETYASRREKEAEHEVVAA